MSRRTMPQPPAYWFGDGPVPAWARALAGVYGALVAVRSRLYRIGVLRRHRVGVPVVVVGNITAGGTGKTPLTIALVERLRAAGFKPGVASRGYGRSGEAQARWVDAATPPADGGDEPVLIARHTGTRIRVDRDRVAAAKALVAAGCDVVICDDGLQHYRLRRDVEIEVIDGARRYGNERMMPAGPLREPVARAAACDFRVVNLPEPDSAAEFGEWPMHLQADDALPLRGGRPKPLSAFAGQRVHAVAGIGNPGRFFTMLRNGGLGVVPHAFADHHDYRAEDFAFGSELPVLMTEKDAVKCAAFANAWFYSVPVAAKLPEAFWIALLEKLGSSANVVAK